MVNIDAPRVRTGMLVQAPRTPPSRLQIIRGQVRAAWKMMLGTRDPRHLADLAALPIRAAAGWLEGRVYVVDPRGNVSLNWRNPLAPIVAAALMPLGLVVSLGIHVYLKVAGRRR